MECLNFYNKFYLDFTCPIFSKMLTTTVLENRIQVNYIHISQKEPEKVYIKTASHEDVGIVAPLKETALELDQ